ncbi:Crp/Fnr family transcriptional regulator [Sphingomonas nostoxanthinifaciens]|uniref:Crp/Fnr family transcriptional regulator n=1 Tax=Sphingomonas nostoxanthinifaciens TaxID=2872652 RepID=UPI001CC1EDE2|nr:Crp/Fnr family transcriptional regulator [Sphingomonas nostoxanthinifaciens]
MTEGMGPARGLLVVDGWARQSQTLPDGRTHLHEVLIPGDLYDLNIFSRGVADCSITTLSRVTIVEFRCERLRLLVEQSAALSRALWHHTLMATAVSRERAMSMGLRTAVERVAHFFCELHARMRVIGQADGVSMPMPLPLTQADLAEATGLTPVHVNRILQDLRTRSFIRLSHRELEILNIGGLREIAMFNDAYLLSPRQTSNDDQPKL